MSGKYFSETEVICTQIGLFGYQPCSDLRKKRLNPQLLNKQCRRRARYERNKNQISGDVGLCQRKLGLVSSQAHAGRTCTAQPSPSLPEAAGWGGRLGRSWMGRLLSRKAQSFVFLQVPYTGDTGALAFRIEVIQQTPSPGEETCL